MAYGGFQGNTFILFAKFPGPTFIPCPTSIADSRVLTSVLKDIVSDKNRMLRTFVIPFSIVLLYNKLYIKQIN